MPNKYQLLVVHCIGRYATLIKSLVLAWWGMLSTGLHSVQQYCPKNNALVIAPLVSAHGLVGMQYCCPLVGMQHCCPHKYINSGSPAIIKRTFGMQQYCP